MSGIAAEYAEGNLRDDRSGADIATAVTLADTRASRRRGLLGRDGMDEGEALMLSPCIAIHNSWPMRHD